MYRLFVAIDFPEDIIQQLTRMCYGLPGARWVDEDQLHLTLRFIGEVDGAQLKEIKDELATIKVAAFRLTLKGIGHFPPRKNPRVLWAGVDKNDTLLLLKNKVDAAISRTGLPGDDRKFAPHVTLARFKEPPSLSRLTTYIAGNNLFFTMPFVISSFHLYSSQLTPKGAIHTIEASYPLGPRS
ncbi:MAG: RNA 2',3'-cyclic phosphodiesterase [Deltaproteobacteria bacterium]